MYPPETSLPVGLAATVCPPLNAPSLLDFSPSLCYLLADVNPLKAHPCFKGFFTVGGSPLMAEKACRRKKSTVHH